jgi:hypothetical protein
MTAASNNMQTTTDKPTASATPDKVRNYMAIDQNGQTFHNLGAYPRKALMERLCAKHCSKMYVGDGIHTGYVIAGLWLSVYEVRPMHEIAGGK